MVVTAEVPHIFINIHTYLVFYFFVYMLFFINLWQEIMMQDRVIAVALLCDRFDPALNQ
jgi:hypothetical protein